ncbi:plasmid replication initiator TrfA [Caballeronia sp. DA-9]|uniref:plasmid replication initiator TrfA n=1 Tax=Caballeronia sp. DA-9 TaxID=3436237 RepID=UPI003F668304
MSDVFASNTGNRSRSTGHDGAAAGLTQSKGDIILSQCSLIVQKSNAQLARERERTSKVDAVTAFADAARQLMLPFWPATFRALPNEIFRSALFNARNRSQKREYLKRHEIYVIGEGQVIYTGEELRQDDETVWLQLIQLAQLRPLGDTVQFTARSFLIAIGWPVKSQSYTRLRDCLTRMQATSLQVIAKRLGGRDGDDGSDAGIAMSMIPVFEWCDPRTGTTLKQYKVQLAQQLIELYGAKGYFTRVEWKQRLDLPDGLATWLHGYLASHEAPFPIRLETIKAGAGLTTAKQKHLRGLVKVALDELKRVKFLKDWSLGQDDLVKVKRLSSCPPSD